MEYHTYYDLHKILQQIENDPENVDLANQKLYNVFSSRKYFYFRSDAIVEFLKKSIHYVTDPELLKMMWDQLDVLYLKLRIAVKLKSSELLLDTIPSIYYDITHIDILFLLKHPDVVTPMVIARALDSLQHITMVVRVADPLVDVMGEDIYEVLINIQHEEVHLELFDHYSS